MNVATIFEQFGFPFALVIILGWYIWITQKTNREDNLKREEQYRQDNLEREKQYREDSQRREDKLINDSADREARLMEELGEVTATNRMLLETNMVLAREINAKLDQIISANKPKGGELYA